MLPHDETLSAELRALVDRLHVASDRRRWLISELQVAASFRLKLIDTLRQRHLPVTCGERTTAQ